MPEQNQTIGNLDAYRTVFTLVMAGISKQADKTGLKGTEMSRAVRNVMEELFKPEWSWAVRGLLDEIEATNGGTEPLPSMLAAEIES